MSMPMFAILALAAAVGPVAYPEPRGGTPLPVPAPGPTIPREKPAAIPAKQLRNALETPR